MTQSTFLLEEHPAKPSRSQDCARDWQTRAAISRSPFLEWLSTFGPAGSFGRTSPAYCRNEQGRLAPSSEGWGNSGMGGPTESWTLNTSEWHSAAVVCLLSHTLERGSVPQRFYLSQRACAGILRRAEKRGKDLPEPLEAALRAVAGLEQTLNVRGGCNPSGLLK